MGSENELQKRTSQKDLQNRWQPADFGQAQELANWVSESSFAPTDYRGKPGDCLMAMMQGNEVGLGPMASLQNIAVINGRPSIWGDAALALVKSAPDFEWIQEWIDSEKGMAVCKIKRKGEPEVERAFSWDDAKRAGLTEKKGPWQTYPKRMLQMRARSWAIRDVFPHVLKGLNIAEESRDVPREVNPEAEAEEQQSEKKDSITMAREAIVAQVQEAYKNGLITEEEMETVSQKVQKYNDVTVLEKYGAKINEHLEKLQQEKSEEGGEEKQQEGEQNTQEETQNEGQQEEEQQKTEGADDQQPDFMF